MAGLLANLSGALIVTVLGMGTIALMLHATWLRTLFDHGHHLNAVVVYSHEIDAATNAQGYLLMCVAFPVIGLVMGMMGAAGVVGNGVRGRPGRPAARWRARPARPGARSAGRRSAGGGRWRRGESDGRPVPRPVPRPGPR